MIQRLTHAGNGVAVTNLIVPAKSRVTGGKTWQACVACLCFPALLLVANGSLASDGTAKAGQPEVAGSEAQPGEKAQALVADMSDAMTSLNYRGEFVHMLGSTVEAMGILHAKNSQGEFERLTSLNGEAREVYRNDQKVTCIWPGSKSVIVGSSKDRKSIPRIDANVLQSEYYRMVYQGQDRVAAREAHVVDIAPEDQFRFGYRFWIDQETKMLLRMMLLDENGGIVEQLMFTSIEYPDSIDPELFEAQIDENVYTLTNNESRGAGELVFTATPANGKTVPTSSGHGASEPEKTIKFKSLPGGYYKVTETYNPMPIGTTPISHVTITDGMASVSVYVEYMAADKHEKGAEGLSRMGAVNAYGSSKQGAFVTVVGEVPASVVEAIGESVILEGS